MTADLKEQLKEEKEKRRRVEVTLRLVSREYTLIKAQNEHLKRKLVLYKDYDIVLTNLLQTTLRLHPEIARKTSNRRSEKKKKVRRKK